MSKDFISRLGDLKAEGGSFPPVHLWNPERVYDFDMLIDKQGRWFHEGSEIKRNKLVKLFSSVLKKEDDDYFLITPVEKARIKVEDVPFLIVEMEELEDKWLFRTNLDEVIELSEPDLFEMRESDLGNLPYLKVRNDLWARFNRNVFYELVELAQEQDGQLLIDIQGKKVSLGDV
jgi:hypothetical protein